MEWCSSVERDWGLAIEKSDEFAMWYSSKRKGSAILAHGQRHYIIEKENKANNFPLYSLAVTVPGILYSVQGSRDISTNGHSESSAVELI